MPMLRAALEKTPVEIQAFNSMTIDLRLVFAYIQVCYNSEIPT